MDDSESNAAATVRKAENADHSHRFALAAQGAILGLLVMFGLTQFSGGAILVGAVGGAALGLTRGRRVLWWGGGVAAVWILVVGFTPLAGWLTRDADWTDQTGPADVAVVLGCGVMEDGSPGSSAEDRLIHAAQLVREGDAPSILICGVLWNSNIRRQLRGWGVDKSLQWSGPVGNTHDEALATAALASEKGWKRVLLVTQPWHMRRAAAVFRSAGLDVLQSPCVESRYDLADPVLAADRFAAVHDWLHEAIGLRIYRLRGWIH
jgi:uncharacterized SAM-binding protein YcdF (DUF218 family)